MITLKRIYEPPEEKDGYRILVDRIWPRGLSKSAAKIDLWMKQIAPSTELRQWFSHDINKWEEFQKRYQKELDANRDAIAELIKIVKEKDTVTFLFAAKDERHNNAFVLKEYLKI